MTVTDDGGASGTGSETVSIIGDPVLNPFTPPPVTDGTSGSATVSAIAPVANGLPLPLTFALSGQPAGMTINAATGVVTFAPSESNAQEPGDYTATVTVAVANNLQASVSESFSWTVGPTSTNQGSGQASRTSVAQGLTQSQEYFNNLVTASYLQYLGRAPQPAELPYWTNQLLASTLSDEQLDADLISSQEFIGDHGGTVGQTWIQGLYQVLLDRTPRQSEVNYWLAQLNVMTPQQIALGFATSQEREGRLVAADYQNYLGVSASTAEIQYWVTVFENGGSDEQVIAGFVGSQQYFQEHGSNIVDWLHAAYQSILSRQVDAAGYQYWENELE